MRVLHRSIFFKVLIGTVLVLTVVGCTREHENNAVVPPSAASRPVLGTTTVLATIADHEKPSSVDHASGNKPAFQVVFSEQGRGVAYLAEISGRLHVIHNGKTGMPYQAIENLRLSPDGERIAYSIFSDSKSQLVVDGKEGAVFDDVGQPVFSPDGRHIACRVSKGEYIYILVDNSVSDGYRLYFGNPVFSADSAKVAYVEGVQVTSKPRLVISDLKISKKTIRESTGDLMVLSADKTRLAARQSVDGKQRVIEFGFDKPDVVNEGQLYDGVDALAFSNDGASLAYLVLKNTRRLLILNGKDTPFPDGNLIGPLVVRPDQKGVGFILATMEGHSLRQAFFHDGTKEQRYEEASDLVYNRDGSLHAYAARKGKNWFVVVNGKEGPAFDRVVAPIFSPDGKKLVYRARKDEKRFVVVGDAQGRIVSQHPAYEQVFQPVFTADGKSVAYGVKDVNKLIWKVEKL